MAAFTWLNDKVRIAAHYVSQHTTAYRARDKCDFDAIDNLNEAKDWTIRKKLGEGSFSGVHKIKNSEGNVLALKTHRHTREWKDYSTRRKQENQRFLNRLEREFDLLRFMNDPNIVSVANGFCIKNVKNHSVSFAMEYLPEGDLIDLSRRFAILRVPFPYSIACNLFEQMVSALAYLERREITHADLKHDNICVVQTSSSIYRFVLTDFGLAMTPGYDKCQYTGRPESTAPEIYHRSEYVPGKSDLWSLWCLLLRLLNVAGYDSMCLRAPPSRSDPEAYDSLSKYAANAWKQEPRFWYWRGCGRWDVNKRLSAGDVLEMIQQLKTPLKSFVNEEIRALFEQEKRKVVEVGKEDQVPADPSVPRAERWLFAKK